MTAPLHHQFETFEQEKDTAELGMWIFLATEVLFFGGLFTAYTVYRLTYSAAFAAASHELDATIGGTNTIILLTSSFFMVLATRTARLGDGRATRRNLLLTCLLGCAFMALKAHEYHDDFEKNLWPSTHPGPEGLFYWIYYAATGLHAVHITIGLCALIWLTRCTHLDMAEPGNRLTMEVRTEIVGLYWHFVDIIWVFLWPLLYLMERHN
jgi:cytochrome c oxidase subunit III